MAAAGIVFVLVFYGLAVGNDYLAGQLPAGGEFTLLRTGGRAFLFDHIEPYSGAVPALVQEQVYGRPAQSGEDAYILDIPFHLLIFFFPLALISGRFNGARRLDGALRDSTSCLHFLFFPV